MSRGPSGRLTLRRGDIVQQRVDAIVNAANTSLLGGQGVDGAIHRAAGPELLAECRGLAECPTGQAKRTLAYELPSAYVIHAVGPIYQDGTQGEPELLAGAYRSCLESARELRLRSLAFPSISTGAYGYPIREASEVALTTILEWLESYRFPRTVVMILFNDRILECYRKTLQRLQA